MSVDVNTYLEQTRACENAREWVKQQTALPQDIRQMVASSPTPEWVIWALHYLPGEDGATAVVPLSSVCSAALLADIGAWYKAVLLAKVAVPSREALLVFLGSTSAATSFGFRTGRPQWATPGGPRVEWQSVTTHTVDSHICQTLASLVTGFRVSRHRGTVFSAKSRRMWRRLVRTHLDEMCDIIHNHMERME